MAESLSSEMLKAKKCLLCILSLPSARVVWFCWALVWEEALNGHNGSQGFFQCLLYFPLSCVFIMLIACNLLSCSGAELFSGTVIFCSSYVTTSAFFFCFWPLLRAELLSHNCVIATECFLNSLCGDEIFFLCILFYIFLQCFPLLCFAVIQYRVVFQ